MDKMGKENWQLSADGLYHEMKPEVAVKYKASCRVQIEQWVAGNAQHNDFGECCPDMSCCGREQWSEENRKKFKEYYDQGDQHAMNAMMFFTLSGVTDESSIVRRGVQTYIAGQAPYGQKN